jgi:hypothetical protein
MHPTTSYELAQAVMTELRQQAQRGARARAARRARSAPARLDVDDDSQYQAVFASDLQPFDALSADVVVEAISFTVHQLGTDGCTGGPMAQECGDYPEAATERMRWARSLLNIR